MAAVGRKNGQRRPAGRDLERDRGADEQQPDQDQDVVAVPELRTEPPDPAEQHDHDQRGEQEPAGEARHVGRLLAQPERIDLLDLRVVDPRALTDDHLALEDLDADVLDGLGGAIARQRVVFSGLNDEFGTTSGLISSAASIRSDSSSPPAMRPESWFRASATAVSRSSVRSVASRTRAASVRTAAQRAASSPTRVGASPIREARNGRLEQRRPLVGGQVGRERGVDPIDAPLEGELLLLGDRDRVLAREVVLRLDGRARGGPRLARSGRR